MTSPTLSRPIYRHADLRRLLNPRSVAIFGVSTNPGALGNMTYRNLAGFAGPVFPINPKYDRVEDTACYASLADTPEPVDCAVISVPVDGVEAILKECAENGIGGAVVFSAGFAETGREDRIAMQNRLADIAREANIRLVGPNCIGIVNFTNGLGAMFNPGLAITPPEGPAIGIVSQSGAMGVSLATANFQGMAISHMLAGGNSCDVTVADYVAYLAEDSGCKAIACVFEGLSEPRRFLEAQDIACEADKPLVVLKLARGESGAKAAMSHTGSLAGSDAAYRAMFRRGGAVVVDQWEALLETAAFFGKAGKPTSEGVAVAGTSGGICIMASDSADDHGVVLPPPDATLRPRLIDAIPDFGTPDNPCDMTGVGRANAEVITDVLRAFMEHPDYGATIIPHAMPAQYAVSRVPAFEALAAETGKPLCVVWTAGWLSGPGALEFEQAPHLPLFRSLDRCFFALKAWHRREAFLKDQSGSTGRLSSPQAAERGRAFIDAIGTRPFAEHESKQLLALYDIPVVDERIVQTADDAVEAARSIGLPVVLKAVSPDLLHKTEAGVIRLNLKTEDDVRQAFDALMAQVDRLDPRRQLTGILVQPMVKGDLEIMLGAKVDPLFGPLVLVGFGGILVELLRDTATALAPVSKGEALALLKDLKGARLLDGFRGSQPVDREKLAETIVRFSELVADQADRIEEIDVNPLINSANGIVAVDALVIPKQPG